jgi:hypothetical protein
VAAEKQGPELILTCEKPAFYVAPETDKKPGRFEVSR